MCPVLQCVSLEKHEWTRRVCLKRNSVASHPSFETIYLQIARVQLEAIRAAVSSGLTLGVSRYLFPACKQQF